MLASPCADSAAGATRRRTGEPRGRPAAAPTPLSSSLRALQPLVRASVAATQAPAKEVVTTRPGTPGLDREQLRRMSEQYTLQMNDAMHWPKDKPFAYDISRGLYYHEIVPNLFVGAQPRHEGDVDQLAALGCTTVLSLQQDKDMHHWGVQPEAIRHRCEQHGIDLVRRPVKDFDPHSLRKVLPWAVQALHEAYSSGGRVYVHCTAGLGRAPGVVIAYLYWFNNMTLDEAYDLLTSIRPCGPKKEAIRAATYDLINPNYWDGLDRIPRDAFLNMSVWERQVIQSKVAQGHYHRYH